MINQNNMIIKLTAICLLKCSNYLIRRLYYIEYKFFRTKVMEAFNSPPEFQDNIDWMHERKHGY